MEWIIFSVIAGVIATAIASSKGRNPVGWFFGGFFLGIIGIVIVAVLSNLKEEKARIEKDEEEHHRLRERMRQEKMKNESFRQHTALRLDSHDDALDMNTRSLASSPRFAEASLPAGAQSLPSPPPIPSNTNWFYEVNGQSVGPITEREIRELLTANKIQGTTLLWREGLSEWTRLDKIETFRLLVQQ